MIYPNRAPTSMRIRLERGIQGSYWSRTVAARVDRLSRETSRAMEWKFLDLLGPELPEVKREEGLYSQGKDDARILKN